ncbi:MAG: hypothetical protein J6D02_07400 [Lachnospira sp.]|nr:hypothetical protein [Lachnospira sp.]
MVEQDYIMRLIKESVRMLMKLLFNIDTASPAMEQLESLERQSIYNGLEEKLDEGAINEAEEELFEGLDETNREDLKLAIMFYSYLNEKDDEFLAAHQFSRQEIKDGLMDVLHRYGVTGMEGLF